MATLHKVVLESSLEADEATCDFLTEYCPEHGQFGSSGAYYVNNEVLKELREVLLNQDPTDARGLTYIRNTASIAKVLNAIEKEVSQQGLYEFYLER